MKGGIRLCAKCGSTSKSKHVQDCTCCSSESHKKCVKYSLSFCDDFFTINLAGLTENLSFQLLKFKGHEVEIETISGTLEHGVICNFGIDFIEIRKRDCTDVLILRDKISKIYLLDDKCCTTSC